MGDEALAAPLHQAPGGFRPESVERPHPPAEAAPGANAQSVPLIQLAWARSGDKGNLFNVGVGTDNLFHSESTHRITLRFTIENLTNKVALYNFLSTFSGTHFVPPRTYQVALGYTF